MNHTTNSAFRYILFASLCLAGEKSLANQQEREAVKAATQALIIQSGVDTMVKNYVVSKVNKADQEAVAKVLHLVKIVETRRIEFEWKF